MTVFKACLQIINRNKTGLSIYIFIAIVMTMGFMGAGGSGITTNFEYANIKTAIINNDEGGVLSEALITYLEDKVNLRDIAEDEMGMKDALLYRAVDYIIVIPENYSADYEAGKNPVLDKMEVAGSYTGTFVSSTLDNFLSTVDTLLASIDGMSLTEAVAEAEKIVNDTIDVEIASKEVPVEEYPTKDFFICAIYSILAAVIIGTGLLVSKFGEDEVKKRNMVAPISSARITIMQTLANLMFGFVVWAALMIVGIIFFKGEMLKIGNIFISINMFVAVIMALAIGFLISQLVHTQNAINAVANTLSLGLSFIGGVFVPMQMMGEGVKVMARFTPTYWYIETINAIMDVSYESSTFSFFTSMKGVFKPFAMECVFIVVCLVLGTFMTKRKTR